MTTEARFYHLTRDRVEKSLPQILQKALERDMRIIVKTGEGEERINYLNDFLWNFSDQAFLPHGTSIEGYAADQPIWITADDENPNQANLLVLCDGAKSELLSQYDLCCYFFDGNNDEDLKQARAYWKALKETNIDLTYWQQNEQGGWQKKNA